MIFITVTLLLASSSSLLLLSPLPSLESLNEGGLGGKGL